MSEPKKIKKLLRVDREAASGLSAFIERPLPTEREVEGFDRVIKREIRDTEVESNLSEIYRDNNGDLMNVKTMKVKKRRGSFWRRLRNLLIIVVLGVAAYLAYNHFLGSNNDLSALEIKIEAPEKVLAGEEFSYQVSYHNPTKFVLSKLRLEIQYPESFVFVSASTPPQSGNYGWNLADLAPGQTVEFSIKGQLINQLDSVNVITAYLNYTPLNLSSQFKKEASASTLVSGPGFQVDLESSDTAFLNQDNELTLIFSDFQNNYLGDFDLSFTVPAEANAGVALDNLSTSSAPVAPSVGSSSSKIKITKSGGAVWTISGLSAEMGRQEVPLKYKITVPNDNPEIVVRLAKKMADGQAFTFWEKTIKPELIKSDLNLTLFLNGSKNDGALNFGQTLNYTLTYNNKGSKPFRDVVIMVAVKGDFLDLNSYQSDKGGNFQNNTVIWTKNEIPALSEIKPGQEGEIDFSLALKPYKESDLGKGLVIIAYSQYSVGSQTVKGDANKSNTINSRINSDLSLGERILYFNDDNSPVGSGPLPPKVGETTSIRVYWTVKNNLHELSDVRAVFNLPSYVSFAGKGTTNVGNLYFDENSHQVIWEIGRLPVSVYRTDAEFNISITPLEADKDKILILSPGSNISATDTETKETINKKTSPKTTKLEDDDIAGLNNSGRVQ